MMFSELTDEQWRLIEPHLPSPARTGRPRNDDDRRTVNGIVYVLTTGCRWMDMPAAYGSHKSIWERHKNWSQDGTWKRIMDALVSKGILDGDHRYGIPLGRQLDRARQKGGEKIGYDGHKKIKGTKIHAAVTQGSFPVIVMISPANIHEGTKLIPLMNSISIETGRRPRKRPKTVYADTKICDPAEQVLPRQETNPIADTGPSQ